MVRQLINSEIRHNRIAKPKKRGKISKKINSTAEKVGESSARFVKSLLLNIVLSWKREFVG